MSFNRFVEAGRVCLINYGPLKGKICVIVDIIDNNKVSRVARVCNLSPDGRYHFTHGPFVFVALYLALHVPY